MSGVLPAWKLQKHILQKSLPGHFFLLYGAQSNHVSALASELWTMPVYREGVRCTLDASDYASNPHCILSAMRQNDLLNNGARVIVLHQAEQASIKCFDHIEQMVESFDGLLIARAGALLPKHPLRQWFMRHGWVVGCYPLSEKQRAYLVDDFFRMYGKVLSSQGQRWLIQNLATDVIAARHDLLKVLLYCGESREVSLQAVESCIGTGQDEPIDTLLDFILAGKANQALGNLKELAVKPNLSAMFILRSMLRTWQQMLEIKAKSGEGIPTEKALEGMSLFFRTRNLVLKYNDQIHPREITRLISETMLCEHKIKRSRHAPMSLLKQSILQMCQKQAGNIVDQHAGSPLPVRG